MRSKLYKLFESNTRYDKFMIACIACSLLPLYFKEYNQIFLWIDRVTVIVFILDYAGRWITADYKYDSHAFLRYPFSFFAIVDILSIVPYFSPANTGLRILRIFRLIKSLRALRILRYSKNFNLILNVIKKEKGPLLAVCGFAFGYVFLSALVMFQAEPDSFSNFFDAFYWSVVTQTTVGYGDIYPSTDIGRIVGMASSFAGIAIVALPTGIITAGYTNELNRIKEGEM